MGPVLFICTGNVFRSVVAEYAFNSIKDKDQELVAISAGTEASPQPVHPFLIEELQRRGADPSHHRQQKLTRGLFESASLPVAMGVDHRAYVKRAFDREILLFNEICCGVSSSILDLEEAHPYWRQEEREAVAAYVRSVIDHIFDSMPRFIAETKARLGTVEPTKPTDVTRLADGRDAPP